LFIIVFAQVYDFSVESSILLRYEELKRKQLEEETHRLSSLASANSSKEKILSAVPTDSTKLHPPSQPTTHPTATTIGIDTSDTNVIKEEFSLKSGLIEDMARETNESKDTCAFYLEMADWNYERASEMMRDMKSE
jgi:hypothetical protein